MSTSSTAWAAQDPRVILAERPMTAFQFGIVAVLFCLNGLDGFDVLAISFAAPGISSQWGISTQALGVVISLGLLANRLGLAPTRPARGSHRAAAYDLPDSGRHDRGHGAERRGDRYHHNSRSGARSRASAWERWFPASVHSPRNTAISVIRTLASLSWPSASRLEDWLAGRARRSCCITSMGQDDYALRRWNVATGALIQKFLGHASRVRAVAYSPDGSLIASAGDDRLIKLWHVESGRELRTIQAADSPVHCLAFSESGLLISGGEDGVARLWDFSTSAQRREQQPRVESAMRVLQRSPSDSVALSALGRWYLFHREWDWATDVFERAGVSGATIDSLTLARCHWMTGQFDRAAAEFNDAAAKHQAPGDYVAICVEAIGAERRHSQGESRSWEAARRDPARQ